MERPLHRSDPQYLHVEELSFKEPGGAAAKQGIETATLSRADADEAVSSITRMPSGSSLIFPDSATVDLLILEGAVEYEGEPRGVGSYICIPVGGSGQALKALKDTTAIVYSNPIRENATPRAVTPWMEPWRADIPGSHGLLHKSLRLPDVEADWSDESGEQVDGAPGGYVRLVLITPGADPRQHAHHKCWEEIFVLRGDIFMGDRGNCRSGSYVSNPVDFYHAPFASQGGAVCIVHTDGPMDIPFDFRDHPEGERQVGEYLTGESLLSPPRHDPM